MYYDYLGEKEGKYTIQLDDSGFVTYKVVNDVCHVCVLYVRPEYRYGKIARELMNHLLDNVKDSCKALTAVCFTKQTDTTRTMRILLAYGFEIVGVQDHDILLYKDIQCHLKT